MNYSTVKRLCLLLLLASGAVFGQDSLGVCTNTACTCSSDISPAGTMISHVHDKGDWMFAYKPMSMGMEGLLQGTTISTSDGNSNLYMATPQSMRMTMHMLMAMYGVTDRFTVMAMLQYQSCYMQMNMQVGNSVHHHGMSSSGSGDTKLQALYALVKGAQNQVIVGVGLNLPTGSISQKGRATAMMYPNLRLPYCMQNGSGTLDVLPSLTYTKSKKEYSYSVQLAAQVRAYKNYLKYNLGNSLEANAWFGKSITSYFSTTLRVQGNYISKIQGSDAQLQTNLEPSASPANYGGKTCFAFLGAAFSPESGLLGGHKLAAEVGLPLVQKVNGLQLATKWVLALNWSYNF